MYLLETFPKMGIKIAQLLFLTITPIAQ